MIENHSVLLITNNNNYYFSIKLIDYNNDDNNNNNIMMMTITIDYDVVLIMKMMTIQIITKFINVITIILIVNIPYTC